jgi:CheY-like chemotaxis protein
MDLLMPRLDGIAATVQIKNRWPGIRVVAHSSPGGLRGQNS